MILLSACPLWARAALRSGREPREAAGDCVQHDDVLCEVETDKAVYPIEASFTGRLKSWQIKVDDTVLIGQAIALVTGDAASVAALPVEAGVESPAVASPRALISPLVTSGPAVAPIGRRAVAVAAVISTPSIHDRKSSPAGS